MGIECYATGAARRLPPAKGLRTLLTIEVPPPEAIAFGTEASALAPPRPNARQVFGFNLSGTAQAKASACQALCQALKGGCAGAAAAAASAPYYHSCGSNFANITTVFRRPYPTDCGGFSFFKPGAPAEAYWRKLQAPGSAFARLAAAKGAGAVTGQAWSGVQVRQTRQRGPRGDGRPIWGYSVSVARSGARLAPIEHARDGSRHGTHTCSTAWTQAGVPRRGAALCAQGRTTHSHPPRPREAHASARAPPPPPPTPKTPRPHAPAPLRVQVPADSPTLRDVTGGKLPWIHLIQYRLGDGVSPSATLAALRQLSVDSIAAVPGYKGWDLLGYAQRPQGVTLGPWLDLGGFVPFPNEAMMSAFLNYSAFHSARHAGAVKRMVSGAHVMFKHGFVAPATFLAVANYTGVVPPALAPAAPAAAAEQKPPRRLLA